MSSYTSTANLDGFGEVLTMAVVTGMSNLFAARQTCLRAASAGRENPDEYRD